MAPLALHPGLADWLRASCHYQPLAGSTVLQLARRIQRWQQWPGGPGMAPMAVAKSGGRARDHLVRHNLRLIVHTWGRMAAGAPSADAFQEAAIQLQRAAERFDPCRGITFATYATPWLRAAFLAHHSATVRGLKLQLELAQLEDDQLKDDQLKDAQLEVAPQPLPEAWLGAVAVRELLALLTPQERHLIRYRYLRTKPLNTRQIARRLALGQGCLADLEHRALAKMQQHLVVARTAKAAGAVIF